MPDTLSSTPKPTFDLSQVEVLTGLAIDPSIADEIQEAYANYASVVFSSVIALAQSKGADVGAQPTETMDKTEFKSLIKKIQTKSGELEALINSLAELDTGLVCKPTDNRQRSDFSRIARFNIEERLQCRPPSYTADEQGFADYYVFHRLLDYFKNFEKANAPFNN